MKKNICLILTATIDPKGMTFLARSNIKDRYNDYITSFRSWCNNPHINNIIFLENSGYDLDEFFKIKEKVTYKKIEVISSNINNDFPRDLGKGYGEYLSLKEIFNKSQIINDHDYIIAVSGRHYVKNIKTIINEIQQDQKDIKICLKDNLTFADTNLYSGKKNFFKNILLEHVKNTNDTKNIFFEHCVAKATLEAINNGFSYGQLSTYPDIYGYIGTNNKLMKYNKIKKLKLYFFGKFKKYFFSHKKY